MLAPQDRRLLLDALRPPPGYQLDRAIGTTFSLDLLALLTAPVAFTFFEWDDNRPDPMALLHSLRQYAGRIRIFCQAGQIKIPTAHRLLYSYLEDSVFEIGAPRQGGVFHPKVWVLRYTAEALPVRYRLLVLSRNLTFDRSWDTLLALDGELTDRQYAFSQNYPLRDFLQALPEMTVRAVPAGVQAELDALADEIQRVEWMLPENVEGMKFWALGLPRRWHQWPFEGRIDRLLILSPFLSDSLLGKLAEEGREQILISRAETLEQLRPATVEQFEAVFAMDPGLTAEVEEPESTQVLEEVPLAGLHAKLYVADQGWYTRIWTGSANATHAAFHRNVEFLVELYGKRSRLGIDALLKASGDGQVLFRDLLIPSSDVVPGEPPDPVQQRLERRLTEARRALATAGLELQVEAAGEDAYSLCLEVPGELRLEEALDVACWPITLPEETSAVPVDLDSSPLAVLGPCSLEALTSFIACRLCAQEDGQTLEARFVLNAPLVGAPEGRQERVLHAMLRDRDKVLRFLLMLLADGEVGAADALDVWQLPNGRGFYGPDGHLQVPLFETLVQSLADDPGRLDRVARLVADLRRTPAGASLLPEDFDEIWEPIWAARQRLEEEA